MRFFQRFHDFRALQWRTGQRLLRSIPYSILYNLSWSRLFYFRTSTMRLRGVRLRRFFIGHRRPILSSYVLNSHSPLFSPTVTSPLEGRVGGGSSRLPCASVLPYIVSRPSISFDQSYLHYVAYVDKMGLTAYPSDKFVHASIPLPLVSQLLSITFLRYIAMMHGIAVTVGSHCMVAQLKAMLYITLINTSPEDVVLRWVGS